MQGGTYQAIWFNMVLMLLRFPVSPRLCILYSGFGSTCHILPHQMLLTFPLEVYV